MKKISELIISKKGFTETIVDDKTVFYFFNKVIEREYGNKGVENIRTRFLKNRKIFLESKSSTWAGEIWMNREEIVRKINQEAGQKILEDIKINN